MKEKWFLINEKDEKEYIDKLMKDINIDYYTAKLLVNRGIKDTTEAYDFLHPSMNEFHDGFLMKDMDKAVDIISSAIISQSKIAIYGDYDCDGVMSTVILYKGLSTLKADFKYHIPDRELEGYGMNCERIKKLNEEGCEVILTCDNGIAAFEEVALAKSLGMKVVVTDHHDIPMFDEDGVMVKRMPEADAVIDIKREDCRYPFKNLCGAATALKLIKCLYEKFDIHNDKWKELIQFAAIATVCDVVDLKDENRMIVKFGLKQIENTDNVGLKCLIEETGLKDRKITATHLGFVIGPSINATGRLESASISVELFTCNDIDKAKELSKKLVDLNRERQELTTDSIESVNKYIEDNNMQNDKVLLVYSGEIHESIAGIVAGKIKEKYYRPTIIMTRGNTMPKGSGRSIDEYNIFEELSKCKEYLEKFGGHPMAAGLSVKEENLSKLRNKLLANCRLTEVDLMPKVRIDFRFPIENINDKIIEVVENIKPYGKGNPAPIMAERNLRVTRVWILGKDKNVIKFRIAMKNSYKTIDAIGFGNIIDNFKSMYEEKYGEEALLKVLDSSYADFNMDIIYVPSINEYNGIRSYQLDIKSIRL